MGYLLLSRLTPASAKTPLVLVELNDPDNIYARNTKQHKRWLKSFVGNCLKKGINSGEINPVQIKENTSIIIMMLNEILYKKEYKDTQAMRDTVVGFWRIILVS